MPLVASFLPVAVGDSAGKGGRSGKATATRFNSGLDWPCVWPFLGEFKCDPPGGLILGKSSVLALLGGFTWDFFCKDFGGVLF